MVLSDKDKTTLVLLTISTILTVMITIYISCKCSYKSNSVVNHRILVIVTGTNSIETQEGRVEKSALVRQSLLNISQKHKNKIGACDITTLSLLDSVDTMPVDWNKIATNINQLYEQYNSFVIIHNTDTMAYTASMLSFMFENLTKPVVITDVSEHNLLVSLLLTTPEVMVVSDNKILRGCRSSNSYDTIASPNYPELGIYRKNLQMYSSRVLQPPQESMLNLKLINPDSKVIVIKLFPGITKKYIDNIINTNKIDAIVLEIFEIGTEHNKQFLEVIDHTLKKGIIVVNVSQNSNQYINTELRNLGVISGYDMTTEAIFTKLYFLLGNVEDKKLYPELMSINMRGEISN